VVSAVQNNLLDEFRKEKFLSWDLERGLFAAWRHGNPEAREQLVRGHLPYVAIVASRYNRHPLFDDLVQSSIICVIEEVDSPRYNPFRSRLQNYLLHRIKQRIYQELRSSALIPVPRERVQSKAVEQERKPVQPPVRIPGGWQSACHHCGKTIIRNGRLGIKRLNHPWYCCPACYSASGARAENTRAARAKVRQQAVVAREALKQGCSSLDAPEDPQEVPDRTGGNPARLIENKEESRKLWNLIKSLPECYATTLRMHYMEGSTFGEIGEALHVSARAVQHYHTRALRLLRACMEESKCFVS